MTAYPPRAILLAILPFVMAGAFYLAHPYLGVDADTPRYLANDPMRTATYPLFLDVMMNGKALLAVQLLMFAAALSWLGVYSAKFLPFAVSVALVLAIGANPYLWELQATIMSEALTTPILTLLIGFLLGFAFSGNRSLLVVAALLCGIATSVRPPCVALFAAPMCAALFAPGLSRRWHLTALMLLVGATPVVAERVYSHVVHGEKLASPLGRHAFMKAAVIDAPATSVTSSDPLDAKLVHALNEDLAPIRDTLQRAKSRHVRYILLTNYEACAAWGCGDLILKGERRSRPDIDAALLRVGLARLRTNPLGYLELAVSEYNRMWLLHPRKERELAREYNAFLAKEGPIPFAAQIGVEAQPTPQNEQRAIYSVNRAALAAVGILAAILTITSALWWRRPLSLTALSLLLGGQGVLVLSAFTAVGLPRYTMGMWPMLIAGVLLGAVGLVDLWRPQLRQAQSPSLSSVPNGAVAPRIG